MGECFEVDDLLAECGQSREEFGLAGAEGAIVYDDARRHIAKKAIARDGRLLGVRLAGETLAQAWLKQAMAEDELDASLIRLALAPSALKSCSSAGPASEACLSMFTSHGLSKRTPPSFVPSHQHSIWMFLGSDSYLLNKPLSAALLEPSGIRVE